ncbi:unnamed protein product, partial [Brassica oleracea var. botrytis]
MRQAGFTEQRLLPALCSGRITARRHSDPLWPAARIVAFSERIVAFSERIVVFCSSNAPIRSSLSCSS